MSAKTIRGALGLLQDDPDNEQAWTQLSEAVAAPEMEAEELRKLLEAARRAHEGRREHDAVAKLLEIEVALAKGTAAESDLQADLARLYDEELLEELKAVSAYKRLIELRPEDELHPRDD